MEKDYLTRKMQHSQLLDRLQCKEHQKKAENYCFSRECLAQNSSILCCECTVNHPSSHGMESCKSVFSWCLYNELLRKTKYFLENKGDSHKSSQTDIDLIFNTLSKDLLASLNEYRQKFKLKFSRIHEINRLDRMKEINSLADQLMSVNLEDKQNTVDAVNYSHNYAKVYKKYRQLAELNDIQTCEVENDIKTFTSDIQDRLASVKEKLSDMLKGSVLEEDDLGFDQSSQLRYQSTSDFKSYDLVGTLKTSHAEGIWRVILLNEPNKIATCSFDGKVMIWENDNPNPVLTLNGHEEGIQSLVKLSDGRLVSGDFDGVLRFWDIHSGECQRILYRKSHSMFCILELPKSRLITGTSEGLLEWDLTKPDSQACVKNIKTSYQLGSYCIKIVRDGEIVCGSYKNINFYRFKESDSPIRTLKGHDDTVTELIISKENKNILISSSCDRTIKSWDIQQGLCLRTFIGHADYVRKVIEFRPGTLVSCGNDSTIKSWNLEAGVCEYSLRGHEGWVNDVVVNAEGMLISSGLDKTVRYWGNKQKKNSNSQLTAVE